MKAQSVFGINSVLSLLQKNSGSVRALYLSDDRQDKRLAEIEAAAGKADISVDRLSRRELDRRFRGIRHQGVVAECIAQEPMSEPQMLQKLMSLEGSTLVLILDGITDPHNLGAILRTAEASGVDAVIAPKTGSVGITPAVRKVASGAAESVAFCQVTNLARTISELKDLGIWFYGAAEEGASNYTAVDYTGSVAIAMGAEGKGLRRLTRESCDGLISIPMLGSVESLNVSVAAGVCLYEVVRQRGIAG
ncbi:23S rRNA (guanosine(2251)-2'-O)-methyltransferase RlmB [Chromatiales bacterium (ex Bugula neritina AB1)]|nr:23S rRNA (guanosine(2251)-2'-O)-methyltransferase RlmB [Chromatiales bacterium (ex Bugula neritina AB1)]